MFLEKLKRVFGYDEPIFTEEILGLFPENSRVQVFRFIKNAVEKEEIIRFDKGIYYIPRNTDFGLSTISVESVIRKKYLSNNNDVYGIYSGIGLLNMFSITTQVPYVIEIISNNESSKCREIVIRGRKFILRKSRLTINNENASKYLILQLFNEIKKDENLNVTSKKIILDYIKEKSISRSDLLELSLKFPPNAMKNLIGSGLINEIA